MYVYICTYIYIHISHININHTYIYLHNKNGCPMTNLKLGIHQNEGWMTHDNLHLECPRMYVLLLGPFIHPTAWQVMHELLRARTERLDDYHEVGFIY